MEADRPPITSATVEIGSRALLTMLTTTLDGALDKGVGTSEFSEGRDVTKTCEGNTDILATIGTLNAECSI